MSSLVNLDQPQMKVRAVALGHTALTVTVSGLKRDDEGRYTILMGVGGNHSVLSGVEGMDACGVLSTLLSDPDLNAYYPQE